MALGHIDRGIAGRLREGIRPVLPRARVEGPGLSGVWLKEGDSESMGRWPSR